MQISKKLRRVIHEIIELTFCHRVKKIEGKLAALNFPIRDSYRILKDIFDNRNLYMKFSLHHFQ